MEILKIDIDDTKDEKVLLARAKKRMRFVFDVMKIRPYRSIVWRTNRGFHLCIYFDSRKYGQWHPREITFLQLAAGSDYAREVYYWSRIKQRTPRPCEPWNVFFSKKKNSDGKLISSEELDMRLSNKLLKILR